MLADIRLYYTTIIILLLAISCLLSQLLLSTTVSTAIHSTRPIAIGCSLSLAIHAESQSLDWRVVVATQPTHTPHGKYITTCFERWRKRRLWVFFFCEWSRALYCTVYHVFKTGKSRCLLGWPLPCLTDTLVALSLQASRYLTLTAGVGSVPCATASPVMWKERMRIGKGEGYNRACAATAMPCDFGLYIHVCHNGNKIISVFVVHIG